MKISTSNWVRIKLGIAKRLGLNAEMIVFGRGLSYQLPLRESLREITHSGLFHVLYLSSEMILNNIKNT